MSIVKDYLGSMLIAIFAYLAFMFSADAQVAGLPENIDKYSVYVGLVVVGVEYLIANTNLVKANSTIDLVLNFIKSIFGLGRFKK